MGTPHTMPRKPWHHATEINTARGYGSQWRKLRASVMRRDKGLCQLCLASHRVTPASECGKPATMCISAQSAGPSGQ